nr:hypothetical protein BaRGS_008625 [Batillaria attramentaria]
MKFKNSAVCGSYARKLARVVSPPGDNRDSNASSHLSTAAVLGIVAAAVVVSVAAFLAVVKRRAIMQTLWPAAPEQAGGGGEEEVHQPLPVGVPEEAPSPQQETVAGRCGNQQLALLV